MNESLIFLVMSFGMKLGLIVGGVIMLLLIILLLIYKVLAPNNILFTLGRENRAVHVMIGKKFSGKVILPSKTLYVDKEDNYKIKSFDDLDYDWEKKKLRTRSFLGLNWVGIYPFKSINERRQQWLEWESNDKGVRTIRVRDEMTPYLIVKPFEYAMVLEEGEDVDGMPLNVYFTIILMPVNAIIPIFGNDNAYGQVQTLCKTQVFLFVKEKSFSSLGGENSATNIDVDEFSEVVCRLNNCIPGRPDGKGLEEILGYKIMDAKLDSVEITGENKKILLEASTAKYIAGENAKAEIAKAEGDKQATILRAEGNKIAGMLGIDVEKYSMDIRKEFYEKIKDMPYAQQIELAKKMFTDSNLTTFVSGKEVTPTVNLTEGGK